MLYDYQNPICTQPTHADIYIIRIFVSNMGNGMEHCLKMDEIILIL